MVNLKKLATKIRQSQNEQGQGLVEYALILVLVAIVVIAVLLVLGPIVGNVFSEVKCNLDRTCVSTAASEEEEEEPNVAGPYIWGTDAFDSPGYPNSCDQLSMTSGTLYAWAESASPTNGDTFYFSDSGSSPPVSGYAIVFSRSCP